MKNKGYADLRAFVSGFWVKDWSRIIANKASATWGGGGKWGGGEWVAQADGTWNYDESSKID